MNLIIYQIGRLDHDFYKERPFQVYEKVFKTSLSSFAIRDYSIENNERPSVVLIYPVSLPLNATLLKNKAFTASVPRIFTEHIESALDNPHEYLKNPYPLFDNHPHSEEVDDFFLIHSIGTYYTGKEYLSLSSHYTDIFFEILFDMTGRYLKYLETDPDVPIKFIIDISSGFNIYVSALIEAARQLGVWLQLSDWHDKEKIPEIVLAFSDPVFPFEDITYTIHFDTLRTKALFSSPINNRDVESYNLSKDIYPDERDHKRSLQQIFEGFIVTYSAISKNTPLAVCEFGYEKKGDILAILKTFIELTKKRLYGNFTTSPDLKKDLYLKVLLTLGFYYGISSLLEEFSIYKHNDSGTAIDDLRASFKKIYDVFGLTLNDIILGNEVDKLKKQLTQESVNEKDGWGELFSVLNTDKAYKETTPQKRNFFAHAGFELNATKYRFENGSLILKYREKHTDLIKKWLKESG
ncbi:MAG: CRISPR-associated CARF protein Csx1 [Syntrophorhabdaceae bacterium]|nr:CRISPR-associated CARF protein Csx1 [Syntrophorhabdaceae bacterium]